MELYDHYLREKQRFLENCTQCGLCAQECPILPHTDVKEIAATEIQEGVYEFMDGGTPDRRAYTKAFACMECFKCTTDCPQGLNPMLVNELIKSRYISIGLADRAYGDAGRPDSVHRVLASVQVSGADYGRIFTRSSKQRARYVFFPGCNVYFQPEKILNALDIMDAIGDEYAFLPGLDHCCGDGALFLGDIEEGSKKAKALMAAIDSLKPEAVVLWCPTCQCRFDKNIAPAMDVPFKVISFPQYLAARMKKLALTSVAAGTVTLHEACKSAYTGVDRNGPREVLRQLPGVILKEMEHHGPDTLCCGSGASCWFPESCASMREARLQEAARTGAQRLVTVCHFCNQTFASQSTRFGFSVDSYVNLVAEAMGIRRDDKFRRYALWGDLDRILNAADTYIAESPFKRERIRDVLQAVFVK